MKIRCTTTFDITATGVTGHYKPSRIPFKDQQGTHITNEVQWNVARNQQRNWETITQLISLRTQINTIGHPIKMENTWVFDFEVDYDTIFHYNNDPLGILKQDCEGVPMLLDPVQPTLNNSNIWFELINNQ